MPGPKTPIINGLYSFGDGLIAIQPFEEGRRVVRYVLSPAHDAVTGVEILEDEHPLFAQPTTGVIVGQAFYYIANAQLQVFRAMYQGGAGDRSALAEVVVLRTPLVR